MTFMTTVGKKDIQTGYVDGRITISISMDVNAQLLRTGKITTIGDKVKKQLEEQMSKRVRDEIMIPLKKTQKELGIDIYGFIKEFRVQHPHEYKKIDWSDEYKDAEITVDVKVKVKPQTLIDTNARKK